MLTRSLYAYVSLYVWRAALGWCAAPTTTLDIVHLIMHIDVLRTSVSTARRVLLCTCAGLPQGPRANAIGRLEADAFTLLLWNIDRYVQIWLLTVLPGHKQRACCRAGMIGRLLSLVCDLCL